MDGTSSDKWDRRGVMNCITNKVKHLNISYILQTWLACIAFCVYVYYFNFINTDIIVFASSSRYKMIFYLSCASKWQNKFTGYSYARKFVVQITHIILYNKIRFIFTVWEWLRKGSKLRRTAVHLRAWT